MPKVFVSSTVFDLLDARSEVEASLRDMRLVPVLSGSATSAFQPLPDQNSIESCLENLRHCDAVVVILCQRYGPSLQPAGYPDISATHLEYNEARKRGTPIHMYVRDRLEADHNISKRNKGKDVMLSWVREERDRKLFDLLSEHRELATSKPGSNWFDVFRDSIDLKTLIRRDFGPLAARSDLQALILENRVPIITLDLVIDPPIRQLPCQTTVRIRIINVGSSPAYRLSWTCADSEANGFEIPVLAPQQETVQAFVAHFTGQPWSMAMTLTYYMSAGHFVTDDFSLGIQFFGGSATASGATCKSKVYHVGSGDSYPFVIASD